MATNGQNAVGDSKSMSLESIAAVVPRLKTHIQLAGFAFAAFVGVLVYRVDPDNTGVLGMVGAIGIGLIAVPLAFDAKFLESIPKRQRAVFLLALLALQLVSFGALGYVAVEHWSPKPQGARFDSRFERVTVFKKPDGTHRAQVRLQLFPLSKRDDQGATVFTGLMTVHDEMKIREDGQGRTTDLPCKKVDSCLGFHLFREWSSNPVLVRGNSAGSTLTATIDFSGSPDTVRVWWELYQKEGLGEQHCGIDTDRTPPEEGIPPLAMYDRGGRKVGNACYRSYGQETFNFSKALGQGGT